MALGFTQPLTEMSTRNISWGKGGRCLGPQPYYFRVPIVLKSGSLNLLEPSGPVMGLLYLYLLSLSDAVWSSRYTDWDPALIFYELRFDSWQEE